MKIAPEKPQRLSDPQGCSQCPGRHHSLVQSSVCCSECTRPIVWHWWMEFPTFFAVLIPTFPSNTPGALSVLSSPCPCVSFCISNLQHHPTLRDSIVIKALHFPTEQGIGFPCLQYLSISHLCACPVSLSALWDVSISLLTDLRSLKLSFAKLLQCQQRCQGTDWGFSQAPVAASC